MGAVEEGGKVAASVVESLRGSPLTLAIVVLNVLFLLFLVWTLHTVSARNERRDAQVDKALTDLERVCEACLHKGISESVEGWFVPSVGGTQ